MNFAFVCHLDPENMSTWSGTPSFIIKTLRELGHSVTSVCPQDLSWHLTARFKGRIQKHFFGRNYHAGRSPRVLKRRAKILGAALNRLTEIDYVLTIFPTDAAFLKSEAPIAIIHDATWSQLLDFYPGLERDYLAKETIEDGFISDLAALTNCKKSIYFSAWARASAIRDMRCEQTKVRTIAPGANLLNRPLKLQVLRYIENRSTERCKLLFVGQDWRRKGADKAVAITKHLNELGAPAELHLVGCLPPDNRSIPNYVILHGFLDKCLPKDCQNLDHLFATSHFFVLPTIAENAGVVFCEAASYGMPSLTHNIGGVATIVQDRKNGRLFDLNSTPLEWAQWIQAVFQDQKAYSQFAAWSLEDAHTRLNWESFCKELVEFLSS